MSQETLEKWNQKKSWNTTYSQEDFLAKALVLLGSEKGLKTQEAHFFLKLQGFSKIKNLATFGLRTSKDYSPTMMGEHLGKSSRRWMNWGTMLNGKCLTANISEYHRTEKECLLSDILEEKVGKEYFLTQKQIDYYVNRGGLRGKAFEKGIDRKIGRTICARKPQKSITDMNVVAVLKPNRMNKRQNGRRSKEKDEPMFTLTAQDKHGVYDGKFLRVLTEIECERLQGFPDNWTRGISSSQRYKQLGNAVTVNVIEAIAKAWSK